MAIIADIRKRTSIIIGLIAVAIIGFVVMDITQGRQGMSGNDLTLGKVAGEKIEWPEFVRTEDILYSGSNTGDTYGRRDYLWSFFVEKVIVEKEADKLGLGVSKPELKELQFGANMSNLIAQRFTNPNTGGVDLEQIAQIKNAIESGQMPAELRPFWAIQEKEVIKERLQNKLTNLVVKGLFSPRWMADEEFRDNNLKANFEYVLVPFDKIADSEVEVSDRDIDSYISRHKGQYKQKEEKRRVDYAVFDVVPTPEDSASIRLELENLKEPFAAAENDSAFVESNYGEMNAAFIKKTDLPDAAADELFTLSKGTVYGPFEDNGFYRIAKVLDRKMVADSVRPRHILFPVKSMEELPGIQARVDSIKTAIENKTASFEDMVAQFSQDGSTSAKGGDLEWVGIDNLPKPLNDAVFYDMAPGETGIVYTQFGIHIVQVTDRKFDTREEGVKIAVVSREIAPSEETQNSVQEKAYDLVRKYRTTTEVREALKSDPKIRLFSSPAISQNDWQIAGISMESDVRDIIRWAFGEERKAGDMSGEVYSVTRPNAYYTSKYVIAGLRSIIPKGLPTAKQMRDELETVVRNYKKAELIKEKIKGKSMDEVAAAYGVSKETVSDASFTNTFTPAGNEPLVVATAIGLADNKTSAPVEGNAGVYLVKTTAHIQPNDMINDAMFRNTSMTNIRRQVASRFMSSLTDRYDIKDKRFKFF